MPTEDAVVAVIDDLLRSHRLLKHLVYCKCDYYVARTNINGTLSTPLTANIPQPGEIDDLDMQLRRNPLQLNGETLMVRELMENIVLLDNPRNYVCPVACVVNLAELESYCIIGFVKTQDRIDYEESALTVVSNLQRNNILQKISLQKQLLASVQKMYDFSKTDSVTFQNSVYKFLTHPVKYDSHKLILVCILN